MQRSGINQSSTTPDPGYQWESDNSQLDTTNESQEVSPFPADTTNESQEVSPFPAGDHKAHINRRSQRHSKHKTELKFHVKTSYDNIAKIYTKSFGHLTKKATMPKYGKNACEKYPEPE